MLNQVTLIGRITKDPELRSTNSDKKYVGFTLAVNRATANKNEVDFVSCYVWNQQAQNLSKYIKKGGLIAVQGTINSMIKNGQTTLFVNAIRVSYLERKNNINSENDLFAESFNEDSKINSNSNMSSTVNETKNSNNDYLFENDNFDDIKWE